MPHSSKIIKNKEVLGDWIARYQNEAVLLQGCKQAYDLIHQFN